MFLGDDISESIYQDLQEWKLHQHLNSKGGPENRIALLVAADVLGIQTPSQSFTDVKKGCGCMRGNIAFVLNQSLFFTAPTACHKI